MKDQISKEDRLMSALPSGVVNGINQLSECYANGLNRLLTTQPDLIRMQNEVGIAMAMVTPSFTPVARADERTPPQFEALLTKLEQLAKVDRPCQHALETLETIRRAHPDYTFRTTPVLRRRVFPELVAPVTVAGSYSEKDRRFLKSMRISPDGHKD